MAKGGEQEDHKLLERESKCMSMRSEKILAKKILNIYQKKKKGC